MAVLSLCLCLCVGHVGGRLSYSRFPRSPGVLLYLLYCSSLVSLSLLLFAVLLPDDTAVMPYILLLLYY